MALAPPTRCQQRCVHLFFVVHWEKKGEKEIKKKKKKKTPSPMVLRLSGNFFSPRLLLVLLRTLHQHPDKRARVAQRALEDEAGEIQLAPTVGMGELRAIFFSWWREQFFN